MKNITLTATGSGYYRVYVDGQEYSQHVTERIAISSAIQAKSENPDKAVWYDHEYIVVVDGDVQVEEEPVEDSEEEPEEDEPGQEEDNEEPEEDLHENTLTETFTEDGQWPEPFKTETRIV